MELIRDYSSWKKEQVNEQVARQMVGLWQRVVGKPLDDKSFKIKIVRDLDVIDDASGKLTDSGFSAILNWVKGQPSLVQKYPGINDLKTNFIIYTVDKDTKNKQFLTFTVEPRSTAPGLDANLQFVSKNELKTKVTDPNKASILATKAEDANKKGKTGEAEATLAATTATKGTITIPEDKLPIEKAKVQNVADDNVKQVQTAILTKFANPLKDSETFKKFQKYGADGKYGPTTSTIVAMVKAGLKNSETSGSSITKEFVDKLNAEKVAESFAYLSPVSLELVEDFDVAAALSAEKKLATATAAPKKKEAAPATGGRINYKNNWKFLLDLAKSTKATGESAVPQLSGVVANYGQSKNFSGEYIAFSHGKKLTTFIYEISGNVIVQDNANNKKAYYGTYLSSNQGGSQDAILSSVIKMKDGSQFTISELLAADDIRELIDNP